jgi:hypothetical protein
MLGGDAMDKDVTIDLELEAYDELGSDGFVSAGSGNSAIAAVGPGPGPGNSAIAAVGPGPGKRPAGQPGGSPAGPLVSWSHIKPPTSV